ARDVPIAVAQVVAAGGGAVVAAHLLEAVDVDVELRGGVRILGGAGDVLDLGHGVLRCEIGPTPDNAACRKRTPEAFDAQPLNAEGAGMYAMLGSMTAPSAVMDAIGALLVPLLGTLERVAWVQRHLYPPIAPRLAEELAPSAKAVSAPLRDLEGLDWPLDLRFMRDRLVEAARHSLDLVATFVEAARPAAEPIAL